jgi:hypothetical protein
MGSNNKSVVLFLEDEYSYECYILNNKCFNSQINKYLYDNLFTGSKIKSFTLDNNKYDLLNRDISYLKNILEIIINKYGNIDYIFKNISNCKIYKEDDLKKIYNIGYIPNMYKLFDLKNNNWNKYYIKSTSISNTLTTILSICQLYNIYFAINIELKNYLYKTVRVSFEDI